MACYTNVSTRNPKSRPAQPADRFGWNAMPLAREDLDSNYVEIVVSKDHQDEHAERGEHTLVSMLGEDCIFSVGAGAAA